MPATPRSRRHIPLTSTSLYAILGLIRAEPGSAYQLNKRMELTYAYFWPRARSGVFSDVKQLAALGLVRGTRATTGRRARTVYEITPGGRAALGAWLATPPTTFALELEALVRVYLADFGAPRDLDGALATFEAKVEEMIRIAREIIPAYLEDRAPPPVDDVVTRALLVDFLAGFASFGRAWVRRSRREVARWRSGDTRAARVSRAHRTLRNALPSDTSG
jgi:DNA-binding PadR family transcriptional regulator